jgi:tRNA-splicing ligase RtcB
MNEEPRKPVSSEKMRALAKKIRENVWEIPTGAKPGMTVPGRIYASDKLMQDMDDAVFEQLTNVACLPGIVKYAHCMPDAHSGYGFPIGGVAAFDPEKGGVISPGGIGFDINCGMRLATTTLTEKDVTPRIKELVDALFNRVPAGVGSKGFLKLSHAQFKEVMQAGSKWCVEQGYGWDEDLARTEDSGCITWADPDKVSERAITRGLAQLGTLGSGNHYLEIQVAENIFDEKTAKKLGITSNDQICVMVHCGSRGFGHQVATDYLKIFLGKMKDYGIVVRDRELACAPFSSKEGQDYFQAMACAANAAFVNRQVILHRIRECFSKVFNTPVDDLGLHLVYDVAHNIAKVEEHKVNGKNRKLVMHRKGATRCFGPGREELPPVYRDLGQPVIVGGSMETGSYLLLGTEKALEETWGSTAHGSGRTMSRTKAKHMVRGERLQKEMEKRGIYVRTVSYSGLAEEAGFAYKPISEVVDIMHKLGISKKVVQFKPLGNVKG